MLQKYFSKIWHSESLKKKIILTLALIVLFEFLSIVPVPGVNIAALEAFQNNLKMNSGLTFFSSLMGGGLKRFSIILMGLSPFINAVIIIQLLAVVIPKLEALKKEGEQGQKKIDLYTRWLTLPLAFAQSYGMIILLNTLFGQGSNLINVNDFWGTILPAMIIITSGTLFLMWLGEIITESGIGNGTSMIILAGVLAGVPTHVMDYVNFGNYGLLAGLTAATLGIIFIIIKFTEGYRKIPLIYTRTGRSEKSYFPIRVNQAGMVPIIFAISLVTFPSLIGQILQKRASGNGREIGDWLVANLSMNNPGWLYIGIYFLLVLGFAFFYVSIVFNTTEIAESIQKRGGYIPGVRPGRETAEYLEKTSMHLNLYGGGFLALIAIFPYLASKISDLLGLGVSGKIDFIISGAGLIIVVGVFLDLIRKIDTELKSYDYKRFY
ncbi:MAG: preprotein translocase subunit SecY [Candidatus Gracilibacteria bacterium]|nr:preprotein translocase subunit SecY [Candidatus Gracilibacteria bacterium]MDD2909026.1 preprotein translocase subunit SecY [Candidatus Gracilibacteria bacterium]